MNYSLLLNDIKKYIQTQFQVVEKFELPPYEKPASEPYPEMTSREAYDVASRFEVHPDNLTSVEKQNRIKLLKAILQKIDSEMVIASTQVGVSAEIMNSANYKAGVVLLKRMLVLMIQEAETPYVFYALIGTAVLLVLMIILYVMKKK